MVQIRVCAMSEALATAMAEAAGEKGPDKLGGKLNKLGKEEGLKPGVFVGSCLICPAP